MLQALDVFRGGKFLLPSLILPRPMQARAEGLLAKTPLDSILLSDAASGDLGVSLPGLQQAVESHVITPAGAPRPQHTYHIGVEKTDKDPWCHVKGSYLLILAHCREPEAPITIYHIGEKEDKDHWWDLCAGPHVERTGSINPDAIDLETVAGG